MMMRVRAAVGVATATRARCLQSCIRHTTGRVSRAFSQTQGIPGMKEASSENQTPSLIYYLSRDEINTILRKKKRPDRMVVTKVPISDEPKLSVEDIKDLEKNLEDKLKTNATSEKTDIQLANSSPAAKAAQSFDFLAYQSKLESMLRGLEPKPEEVKYFKYDLPIPNIDPGFRGTTEIADILRPLPTTPNENLWNSLPGITGDSSYEEFETAIEKKFNFEVDMYGDKEDIAQFQNYMLETFGEEILPAEKLSNHKYMARVRDCFTLNLNMPGAMETVAAGVWGLDKPKPQTLEVAERVGSNTRYYDRDRCTKNHRQTNIQTTAKHGEPEYSSPVEGKFLIDNSG